MIQEIYQNSILIKRKLKKDAFCVSGNTNTLNFLINWAEVCKITSNIMSKGMIRMGLE